MHIWRNGDVVMWDNRATMHLSRPRPAHEARLMVRTTISATKVDGLESVRLTSRYDCAANRALEIAASGGRQT